MQKVTLEAQRNFLECLDKTLSHGLHTSQCDLLALWRSRETHIFP